MGYDFELGRVISKIKAVKAKTVCLQLPDGLKPKAKFLQKEIEAKTNSEVFIWLGSCYGACDTPELKDAELLVQFGHTEWV